jgi:hypothetical protein
MKVDEDEIQRRIDHHLRWPSDPGYRLDFMEDKVRSILADPSARITVNIRKGSLAERVNQIILPSKRSGLLVGPDGKPV